MYNIYIYIYMILAPCDEFRVKIFISIEIIYHDIYL